LKQRIQGYSVPSIPTGKLEKAVQITILFLLLGGPVKRKGEWPMEKGGTWHFLVLAVTPGGEKRNLRKKVV